MKVFAFATLATAFFFGQANAKGHTAPFPEEFDIPTCNYIACLKEFLSGFGEDLGDIKLNRYSMNAATKTRIAKKAMEDYGNAVVSVDRLLQAVRWIQNLGSRADNLGNDDAVEFAMDMGDEGSTCAIELLDDMIMILSEADYFEDDFLDGKPTRKLNMAKALNENGEWKRSVKRAFMGIRLILNEAGERDLPICLDDH